MDCSSVNGSLADVSALMSQQLVGKAPEKNASGTTSSQERSGTGTPHVPRLGGLDADADKVCVLAKSQGQTGLMELHWSLCIGDRHVLAGSACLMKRDLL